jgi:ABC-type multidrug transport system fused ATPase/permease subunit
VCNSPDHPAGLRTLLPQLWVQLSPTRRWQLGVLLLLMIASGLAEIVSLAALVPFLSVLADPARFWQEPRIRGLAEAIGYSAPGQLLLPLTLLFAACVVVAGLVRLVTLWLSGRLAAAIGSDLAEEAYRRTLHQPYLVHVSRNSSTITTAMISHIDEIVYFVLNPLLMIVANLLLTVAITAGLFFINPWIALLTTSIFSGAYLLISAATKQSLAANGRSQATHAQTVMQNVQEGLGAIRDVLLDHSQSYYLARYRLADRLLRRLRARAELLSAFPRVVIEAGAMAGVAALSYALVTIRGGIAGALPVLGAMALGAQRLLPALQQIYVYFSQLQTYSARLGIVLDLLDQPADEIDRPPVARATFAEVITLEDVSFRYQPDLPFVLRDVVLEIRRGERVAVVGPTGSGKSTLTDILMGLLPPSSGRLLIDGREVAAEAWQANIAHVPQSIFLADTSIAENIALGIPAEAVDQARLRAAAAQAQIASFIESLPRGYATTVGERGVRLSGGQRQRIGIARALYKRADVLVFDEATSALDDATERALMETLASLPRDLTIILVAHRLSTTTYCDRVVTVANSSIQEQTTSATSSGS